MDINTLQKMDDGAYTGNMASFEYDFDFTLQPTGEKRTEKSPDFEVMVRTPRNRFVSIGAAWAKKAQTSGNEYLSLSVDIPRIGRVNVNGVKDEEADDTLKIIPFAASETAT